MSSKDPERESRDKMGVPTLTNGQRQKLIDKISKDEK